VVYSNSLTIFETMGYIMKINWVKAKKLLNRAFFLLVIFVTFASFMGLLSTDNRPETPVLFLISALIILGFFFGNYVSRVFLKQPGRYQTRVFVFLPILSFLSVIILGALISGMRRVTPVDVILVLLVVVLFALPLGMFAALLYRKLKQQVTAAEAAAAHSKSELQLLQSQLSPHFLFNTLNNLYGIALREPEKTPGMLLRLSELLRYSVYDAKDTFVPLKDELNYLKNYIEFEKIRIGDRLDLKVDIENFNLENIRIAPMLLVVFVENAFKHAKNNLNENIQIEISMKLWINQILFAVKNSHKDTGTSDVMNKHSGFGLQNTIKRLELQYPNAHDLKIEKDEDSFSVMLRVNIKRSAKK
jgi:sensor histidine kinase YesM